MTPRRRRLAVLAFVAAAAWGHWLYWYQPRLHPDAPGDDGLGDDLEDAGPARLLHDPRFADAAWIAHPHQTLPALGRRTGLDREAVEALGRLLGADLRGVAGVQRLPARSLAVAAGGEEQWTGAARVHPLAAGFLRLSGLLADNPLLAGGRLDLGESGDAEVRWRWTEWSIRSARAPEPPVANAADAAAGTTLPSPAAQPGPALAWIRLAPRADPWLPSGLVSLSSSPQGLVLAGGGEGRLTPADLEKGRQVLERSGALVALRRGGVGGDRGGEILLLYSHPPGTPASELPRSAILYRGAESGRSDLPGESLLEIAGEELSRGARGGWRAVATDARALAGALAAAAILPAGLLAADDGPRWALAVDLAPAASEIARLAAGLENSPLLPLRERRRWSDAACVLAAVGARPGRLDGVVTADGRVLLRLEHEE